MHTSRTTMQHGILGLPEGPRGMHRHPARSRPISSRTSRKHASLPRQPWKACRYWRSAEAQGWPGLCSRQVSQLLQAQSADVNPG